AGHLPKQKIHNPASNKGLNHCAVSAGTSPRRCNSAHLYASESVDGGIGPTRRAVNRGQALGESWSAPRSVRAPVPLLRPTLAYRRATSGYSARNASLKMEWKILPNITHATTRSYLINHTKARWRL